MADEEHALVCLPVDDRLPDDPTSTRGHYCAECNAEVWMSTRAREFVRDNPNMTIICAPCSIDLVDVDVEIRAVPGDVFGQAVIDLMPQIIEQMYGPKDKD